MRAGVTLNSTPYCGRIIRIAAEFVRTVQHRQGVQIACLEEIAFLSLIDAKRARALAAGLAKSPYGAAILRSIAERR